MAQIPEDRTLESTPEEHLSDHNELHRLHNILDNIDFDGFDLDLYQLLSEKGSANGYAELDSNGTVPAAQLPSYVDDVIEAANFAALPGTGVASKIYVTLDDGKTWRWSGSAYTVISDTLALGETSTTAYRGDRGKTAYDHSQVTGNPHGVTKGDVGLGNADNTSDANKPVSTATQTAINAGKLVTIPADKTADHTLVLADAGSSIGVDSATAKNLTVPLDSSVAYPVGTIVEVRQVGVGQVTIVATGGVTFRSAGGALKLRAQFSAASLLKVATDTWSIQGDLTT